MLSLACVNPLVPIAVAWIAGLVVAAVLPTGLWQPTIALVALGAAVLVTVKGWRQGPRSYRPVPKRWNVVALCAVLSSGLAVGPVRKPVALPPAGLARLQVMVERCRHQAGERARSIVRVLKGERLEDGHPFPKGVLLRLAPTALPEGATVELLAQVRPWVPFRNPSPHPALPSSQAIQGRGWIPSKSAVEVLANSQIKGAVERARSRVRRALIQTLPQKSAGIARALILGDAGAVDRDDKQSVRAAGLAHVLAVSGMHVVILVGIAVASLRQLLIRLPWLAHRFEVRRIACALGVPVALIFALFAGGAPSAWRAAITACIGWTFVASGKRPQASAVASIAAIALGAMRPHEAVHPSFLLSIVATTAILSAPQFDQTGLADWVKSGFTITFRITIATSPIVLWAFGTVPLTGLIANVLLLPVASLLLMPLAALHAFVATLCAPLAALTAFPLSIVANAFITACRVFALLPFSRPLPPPDIAQGITIALAAILLLAVSSTRWRVVVCVLALLALAAFEVRLRMVEQPRDQLRVTYLDVGQGDSALIDLPDGRLMVIDGGGNPHSGVDPGRAVLVPLLRARRRARVDVVVLSHPHPDHFGGLFAVLENVAVDELWDTGQAEAEGETNPGEERTATSLLKKARAKGTRIKGPRQLCHKPRAFGAATVEVLWPCPRFHVGLAPNDNSFVLRIEYSGQTLLFTGDIEAEAERVLVKSNADLKADVLKVPHHGSKKSNTPDFLKAVSPRLAVISNGLYNRYGHPAVEVIERLEQLGSRIIRLDREGGTAVVIKDETVRIER